MLLPKLIHLDRFDDGQKLHGIVFLHRITDTRVDGGSARSLNLFGNICGADFLKNTVMVTTMWDKRRDPEDLGESEDVERDLLSEHWSHFLKVDTGTEGVPVVESIGGAEVVELAEDARSDGSAMYARSYNNKQNCEEIIRRIVAQAPGIPVLQKEVGEEGKGIGETEAGKELDRELAILQEEHLKAIDELGKLHEEALKASETRTAAMLEEEKKLREEQMAISERDRIELSKRVEGEERERKKMEAELKEQQKKQEKERRETKEKFEKQEKEQREMNEKQEKERREMREKLEKQEEERREMKEKLEEQAKDQQRLQERLEEQGRKAREPQPGRGPLGLLGGVLDDVAKIMFQPLIAGPAVNPILDTSGSYRRFLGI